MRQFRRSFGAQDTFLRVNGQGSFGTCGIGVSLTRAPIGFQKAKSDSASFGGPFSCSGNNLILAFKSPLRLDGPNALTG